MIDEKRLNLTFQKKENTKIFLEVAQKNIANILCDLQKQRPWSVLWKFPHKHFSSKFAEIRAKTFASPKMYLLLRLLSQKTC